jgi:hypothetical protein
MHKGWIVLAACCGFMMLQVPYRADAATTDAAAEEAENQKVIHRGTDFYMQIEEPETQEEEPEIIETPEATQSHDTHENGGSSGNGGGRTDNGDSSDTYASSDEQSITYYNLPLGTDADSWGFEDTNNSNHNSDFPKTGDYGPDKTVLFELALLFGAGYLLCDYYEKRMKEYSL